MSSLFRRAHFTAEGSISLRIIGLISGPFIDKVLLLSSTESLPAFCDWDGQKDMNSALDLSMLAQCIYLIFLVVYSSSEKSRNVNVEILGSTWTFPGKKKIGKLWLVCFFCLEAKCSAVYFTVCTRLSIKQEVSDRNDLTI